VTIEFVGNGDYVEDADGETVLNGLAALTASLWQRTNSPPNDLGFITCEVPTGNDSKLTIRNDLAGATYGGVNLFKMAVTVVTDQQLESSSNAQTANWMHLLFTWSSGNIIRFFIDGVEDTPTGADAAQTGTLSGLTTIRIGQSDKTGSPTVSFNGSISDVRFYGRVLSDAEIATIHAARGIDGIVDGLVGRWPLDEGPEGGTVVGADSVKGVSVNKLDMSPVLSPGYADGVLRSRRRVA
jgi:hypothetical protein